MNSLTRPANSFLQSTTTLANSALKAASSVSSIVTNSTTTLGKNISSAVNSGMETVNDTFHDVVNSTSSAIKNVPILNSLVKNGQTGANSSKNGLTEWFNSGTGGTGSNGPSGKNGTNNSSKAASSGWIYPIGIFLFLVLVFVAIFTLFSAQIKIGIDNITATLRRTFGESSEPVNANAVTNPPAPVSPVLTASEQAAASSTSIINKILPLGQKEVFNISTNDYTYYDAEPLCRALGAELATYSQVKDAWEKGADWCNYGWVKGQAAVYPTQKETWSKLQRGPEDEKYACGNPGVNGGYFDNPEMRFGVSCYGTKPSESSNNEKDLMARGTIPKTPAALKVDKQIQEYKDSLDTIGILPFNSDNWSE